MGVYITNADIVAWLGNELAAKYSAESGGTPDTVVIDENILDAESVLHRYVAQRATVPIDSGTYPAAFAAARATVKVITIFKLAGRRPPIPEDWKLAYDKEIAWLEKVEAGEADLPGDGIHGSGMEFGSNEPDRLVT